MNADSPATQEPEEVEQGHVEKELTRGFFLLVLGECQVDGLNELAEDLAEKGHRSADDVARSALVMAGAAMDASVKQVVRDCLTELARLDPDVRDALAKHLGRQIKRDFQTDAALLTKLLIWREEFLEEHLSNLVGDLTSKSLQSVEELNKVHALLGVEFEQRSGLRDGLEARHEIVHEMDAVPRLPAVRYDRERDEYEGIQELRRERDPATLRAWCGDLLETGYQLMQRVNYKLRRLRDQNDEENASTA